MPRSLICSVLVLLLFLAGCLTGASVTPVDTPQGAGISICVTGVASASAAPTSVASATPTAGPPL